MKPSSSPHCRMGWRRGLSGSSAMSAGTGSDFAPISAEAGIEDMRTRCICVWPDCDLMHKTHTRARQMKQLWIRNGRSCQGPLSVARVAQYLRRSDE